MFGLLMKLAEQAIPRITMTDEEKELFQGIADAGPEEAARLSRAVRNRVLGRPPPEEEDRLCVEKVGLTMAEVRAKALATPEVLTEAECLVVTVGADHGGGGGGGGGPRPWRRPFWIFDLPPEEQKLAREVQVMVMDEQDVEASARAGARDRAEFETQRRAREAEARKRKGEEARREMDRVRRANTPRWANEMRDGRMRRWGFVVFRTAYGGGTDLMWDYFQRVHSITGKTHLHDTWWKTGFLMDNQRSVWVGDDASLDRADVGTLRRRFRAMREQGEIPAGIATDCFLVVDEATLSHPFVLLRAYYKPNNPQYPDPWATTLEVRAIDPDHDDSAPVPTDGDLAGFTGEISIPLPKIFDWLYYCFFAKSEDWETRYKATKSGPAEVTKDRLAPYPAYRSGSQPRLPSQE